ncbi:hypothetical protein TorRG33x02_334550, partial [Trema orientale]
ASTNEFKEIADFMLLPSPATQYQPTKAALVLPPDLCELPPGSNYRKRKA